MSTRVIRGLFWKEWLLHQGELRWIFAAWLFGVWVFPLQPPYFLLPFGILSALMMASGFGGSEASEGSEEFSFSLPPTRSQRYLVRLALGGGSLAFLLIAGTLAGLYDFPQNVWGLFFESGFTVPFNQTEHRFVYALALLAPLAIFSEAFAAGSSSRSPEGMGFLWLRGLFVPGLILGGSFMVEGAIWKELTGWVSNPVLGFWALLRLVYGYRDYQLKEGISGLPRLVVRSRFRWWILLLLALIVVLVFLVLLAGRAPEPPMMRNP